jgi:hypothetical protein
MAWETFNGSVSETRIMIRKIAIRHADKHNWPQGQTIYQINQRLSATLQRDVGEQLIACECAGWMLTSQLTPMTVSKPTSKIGAPKIILQQTLTFIPTDYQVQLEDLCTLLKILFQGFARRPWLHTFLPNRRLRRVRWIFYLFTNINPYTFTFILIKLYFLLINSWKANKFFNYTKVNKHTIF